MIHGNFRRLSLSKNIILSLIFTFFATKSFGQAQQDDLLVIVESELNREMTEFKKLSQPPYFLAYRIYDSHSGYLSSSFGSLVGSDTDHSRILVTDVKVGDYSFDSSHPITNYEDFDGYDMPGGRAAVELPLDNKPEAIKLILWQQTQNSYRQSLNFFKALKNAPQTEEKPIADFSKEKSQVFIAPPLRDFSEIFDAAIWSEKVKKYSAPFSKHSDIIDAEAALEVSTERKYLITSEGARIVQNRTFAYLTIRGSIRAVDGDIIPLHQSYFALEPSQLPTDETVLLDVEKMIVKLNLLRTAPVAEPYTGPAILYSRAAGVFFHEIFGHRVEGHRLKDKNDGQTFKGKLQEQVLPKSLSVTFDPTLSTFNGQPLNGHYQFDDEGIVGQKVKVVENGILKTFLMSRTPIESFSNSNGHGRAQAGAEAVSRQSNLLIENTKSVPMSQMRKMLVNECKKQRKPYGYLFMDVVGGFTTTNRYMPNAFNIFPTEVYRVYTDGRPDELVRGVDLIGTPLAMFAAIQAADDKNEVFTGFCGAESGSVPVTAISPSLFVQRIETQKKPMTQIEKNILERPVIK
ncbi:MAG TPA: metallopeptidase TldD-related protein [Chryseolinea sp.]